MAQSPAGYPDLTELKALSRSDFSALSALAQDDLQSVKSAYYGDKSKSYEDMAVAACTVIYLRQVAEIRLRRRTSISKITAAQIAAVIR